VANCSGVKPEASSRVFGEGETREGAMAVGFGLGASSVDLPLVEFLECVASLG